MRNGTAQQIHSKSNLITNATQLQPNSNLQTDTTQIHSNANAIMISPKLNTQAPPTHSRITFQSTPNSAVNSTRSSNDGQTSPNLELSKEEIIENNLTQLFTKGFLAVLTRRDAVLKEMRDCILQNDAQRCKEVNPYLFSY